MAAKGGREEEEISGHSIYGEQGTYALDPNKQNHRVPPKPGIYQ
jgi:hypothetical protein